MLIQGICHIIFDLHHFIFPPMPEVGFDLEQDCTRDLFWQYGVESRRHLSIMMGQANLVDVMNSLGWHRVRRV
jgi:hypothetical protein